MINIKRNKIALVSAFIYFIFVFPFFAGSSFFIWAFFNTNGITEKILILSMIITFTVTALIFFQIFIKRITLKININEEKMMIEVYSLTSKPFFICKKQLTIDKSDILELTICNEYRRGHVLTIHFLSRSEDNLSKKEVEWKFIQLAKNHPGYHTRYLYEFMFSVSKEELEFFKTICPTLEITEWQDKVSDSIAKAIYNSKKK